MESVQMASLAKPIQCFLLPCVRCMNEFRWLERPNNKTSSLSFSRTFMKNGNGNGIVGEWKCEDVKWDESITDAFKN